MTSTTSIHLDPGDRWDYLSPESIPPNVPTTGEDSVVIAPWLEEPVRDFQFSCSPSTGVLIFLISSSIANTSEQEPKASGYSEHETLGYELHVGSPG